MAIWVAMGPFQEPSSGAASENGSGISPPFAADSRHFTAFRRLYFGGRLRKNAGLERQNSKRSAPQR